MSEKTEKTGYSFGMIVLFLVAVSIVVGVGTYVTEVYLLSNASPRSQCVYIVHDRCKGSAFQDKIEYGKCIAEACGVTE